MEFGFSDRQEEVRQLARRILSDQVTAEKLSLYDDFARPRFDRALWQQLADAGLLGVAIAEHYGGSGFGFAELALVIEEAGRTIAPVPVIPHAVSALAIQRFGSEEQCRSLLPGAADGTGLLTTALAEPWALEPAASAVPSARGRGDYRIDGVKTCVPFAGEASRILMSATVETGTIVVLVDPAAAGVTLTETRYTTYEPLYELRLEDVLIPADAVLVGPDAGAGAMRWITERTVAAVCIHQLGVTDAALRMTASYTAERQQFGVPIATFQAVGHRAANGFIDVECLRLTAWQAVSLCDAEAQATTEVHIAKIWAGDVGHRVSYSAQHLHGGTGIDRDYPLWRYCLWARHNEALLGGSARHLAALGQRVALGEAHCR